MAESIYVQLENGSVVTPVNGTDYRHELPDGLFPTAEQFESPEKLIAWADENDYTAKLIQKGLQKAIIEVRACFKSCKKDETWTEEMGIKNVAEMEWKTVNRPEGAMSDESKALKLLSGMTPEQVKEMLAKLDK